MRTDKGKLLGRVDVNTFEGLENWTPPRDLIVIIEDLKRKGRL
jgi:hypothetical protein